MATTVVSSNLIGAAAVEPFVANGDKFILLQGVNIVNTSGNQGLYSTNFGSLVLNGDVIGYDGVNVGTIGAFETVVQMSTTSHIESSGLGLFVRGIHHITDYGTISATLGIGTYGAGEIYNSGQITATGNGIENRSPNASDVNIFYNAGSVIATGYAYLNYFGISIDQITNVGTMKGGVVTGESNDTLANYGHIYGNIYMGDGNDTVYTDLNQVGPYTLQGGVGTDTLVNIDNDHTASVNLAATGFEIYYGGQQADYIYGGTATAALTFVGGGGADAFIGGAGNDVAIGGTGGDYMDGGAGTNTLSYSSSLQGVSVNLLTGNSSAGDAQGDYFLNMQNVNGSAANDTIYGDNNANTLYGDAGNDVLVGGGGNDLLIGGAGNDYLYGASGNDIFYFAGTGFGQDVIADFTIGQDTIYLSTAIAANFAALTLFQFGANTYLIAGADRIEIDNVTATNLHATDFVFF